MLSLPLSVLTVLERQDTVYDAYGRPVRARLFNGGTVVALTQFSYDNRSRPVCTAARMNPATF